MKISLRIAVIAILAIMGTVICPSAQAVKKSSPQNSSLEITSWNKLQNVPVVVVKYGLYDNGNMVNEFYPKDQGFQEGEILTHRDGKLKWVKKIIGNRQMDIAFDARVDGLTLYTSSPEEDILWIKMLEIWEEGDTYLIYTVDNRNTYRFFLMDYNTYIKNGIMEGFLDAMMND